MALDFLKISWFFSKAYGEFWQEYLFFSLFPMFSQISYLIGNFYDEQPGSGAFAYFNPEIIAATATLITLFVELSTFIKRHKLKYKKLDFI